MPREYWRRRRRAKESDAFKELNIQATEKMSNSRSEQANGDRAEHDRDEIARNDAQDSLAEKIKKLRISKPTLHNQVSAEHKKTIHAQYSKGNRGAGETVKK